MAETLICAHCGSDDILQDAWVNPNDHGDIRWFDYFHCVECDGRTTPVAKSDYKGGN